MRFVRYIESLDSAYIQWANTYGVDLSVPFEVIEDTPDFYIGKTPKNFKSEGPPPFIRLSKLYFIPATTTTQLEDWL
jgi:hypothetical protein